MQNKSAGGNKQSPVAEKKNVSNFIRRTSAAGRANDEKPESAKDTILDLFLVKQAFDKWYKEEESLSGVMNMKVTKQKNLDFR